MNPTDRRAAAVAPATPPVPPQIHPLPRPCSVRYGQDLPAPDAHTLALVVHGQATPQPPGQGDPRHIGVDLPLLHGPAMERWESPEPVSHGWDGAIGYAHNSQVLMGQVRLPEAALASMEQAANLAYRDIERVLARRGYPAWLRVWNYIPHIHLGSGDDERYRRFVQGRYEALATQADFERRLPAATAIGTAGGELLIYFLAARSPGLPVENPRQVSAYRYPRQYGPRSPSFSRAMLAPWQPAAELLVSGTASVVGHQTLHAGDPALQLAECLANVRAVIGEASQLLGPPPATWTPGVIKLYVRHAADAPGAMAGLAGAVANGQLVVMQGDICRTDLSLELEASYSCCAPGA